MYSVVISSLGRKQYLCELLESIYSQTLPPGEIIVLLDNEDHCRDVGQYLAERYNPLSIIYTTELNLPGKRNYGCKISNNDIVFFSDDDDIWALDKASLTVNLITELGAMAVCHNYSIFGIKEQTNCNRLGRKSRWLTAKDLTWPGNTFGGGSSIACIKDVVNVIPFNAQLNSSEDYEWWMRCILADVKIWYVGKDLVSYRRHSSNMTSSTKVMLQSSVKVANKKINVAAFLTLSYIWGISKLLVRAFIYHINAIFP